MQQSLADPEAYVPSIVPLAGIHLQDSHWDVSDAHHPCQSSAESEAGAHKASPINIIHGRNGSPVVRNKVHGMNGPGSSDLFN